MALVSTVFCLAHFLPKKDPVEHIYLTNLKIIDDAGTQTSLWQNTLPSVAWWLVCLPALVDVSGMIRTQMGIYNRSEMVAVLGAPCVIPPVTVTVSNSVTKPSFIPFTWFIFHKNMIQKNTSAYFTTHVYYLRTAKRNYSRRQRCINKQNWADRN
jgi:hypothetical protein